MKKETEKNTEYSYDKSQFDLPEDFINEAIETAKLAEASQSGFEKLLEKAKERYEITKQEENKVMERSKKLKELFGSNYEIHVKALQDNLGKKGINVDDQSPEMLREFYDKRNIGRKYEEEVKEIKTSMLNNRDEKNVQSKSDDLYDKSEEQIRYNIAAKAFCFDPTKGVPNMEKAQNFNDYINCIASQYDISEKVLEPYLKGNRF